MSTFGIIEWHDARYPSRPRVYQQILDKWADNFPNAEAIPDPPVVCFVAEQDACSFLRHVRDFIIEVGRPLSVLGIISHGDQHGLCPTSDPASDHVAYEDFWSTLVDAFDVLNAVESPEEWAEYDVLGKAIPTPSYDIGDAGDELIILLASCKSMGDGCAFETAPQTLRSIIGYTVEPIDILIERLFLSLSRHQMEAFETARDVFRRMYDDLVFFTDVNAINDELEKGFTAVAEMEDRVIDTAKDPRKPYPGTKEAKDEEGELVIWQPDQGLVQLMLGETKGSALLSSRRPGGK